MLLLVDTGSKSTKAHHAHPCLGRLTTPKLRTKVGDGLPWGADNGAYSGFNETSYRTMIRQIMPLPGCLFLVAPDVVGKASETRYLFNVWRDELKESKMPLAYVLQDGCTRAEIPWSEIKAIFIGGTTKWKLGHEAAKIVTHALGLGLWVHMGRVNSLARMDYAAHIGCSSVDGSKAARWPDIELQKLLNYAHRITTQGRIFA